MTNITYFKWDYNIQRMPLLFSNFFSNTETKEIHKDPQHLVPTKLLCNRTSNYSIKQGTQFHSFLSP